MIEVTFYTDGACTNNHDKTKPGIMGVGIVAVCGEHEKEYSLNMGEGTNQQAELHAVLAALARLKGELSQYAVVVVTDSGYAIGCLTKEWKVRVNQVLVAELKLRISQLGSFRMEQVKGHEGHELNERADRLAVQATRTPA